MSVRGKGSETVRTFKMKVENTWMWKGWFLSLRWQLLVARLRKDQARVDDLYALGAETYLEYRTERWQGATW